MAVVVSSAFWNSLKKIRVRGIESRIVNRAVPRTARLESPEILQREAKNELNRSKVGSQEIDSESLSKSYPINA